VNWLVLIVITAATLVGSIGVMLAIAPPARRSDRRYGFALVSGIILVMMGSVAAVAASGASNAVLVVLMVLDGLAIVVVAMWLAFATFRPSDEYD
jgi:hypothetical protein